MFTANTGFAHVSVFCVGFSIIKLTIPKKVRLVNTNSM